MMADFHGMADNGAADAAYQDEERLIELVGFLVQGIVAHPEDVEVEEFFDDLGAVYGVRVHADDTGRVIGREGRVAGALRHLVKASSVKSGAHVTIEILTEDSPLSLIDDEPETAPVATESKANANTNSAKSDAPAAESKPAADAKSEAPVATEAPSATESSATTEAPAEKAALVKAKPKAKPRAKSAGAAAPRRGMMPRGGDQTIGKDAPPATEESSDG